MGFADSVKLSAEKMQTQLNAKVIEIATDLFSTTVGKTPVGSSPTKGELIDNWYVGLGVGNYNKTNTLSRDTSGTGSYARATSLSGATEFSGKDGEVSFTNTTPYGYRAEYFGWNFSAPEGRWRGTSPYRMMANSLSAIVAKYGK